MAEYYLGIDLGTTNTTCAVLKRGRLETAAIEGEPICPSVVCFTGQDEYMVGRSAKRRMMIDPEHTIVSVKRNMGRLNYCYNQYGKEYTPAQISSYILAKVKQEAEKDLGSIKRAVITVPAYFNDDQRKATREAGELAGFEVLQLLSEPTAAAVAYGLNQGKDQSLAVYDLGGGTFDVSILEVKGNTFTVKAVGGNHRLGGDDFDKALVSFVSEAFRKQTHIDLNKEATTPELLAAKQKLKEECQKKKEELSESEESEVEIPNFYKGHHVTVPVSRPQFEKLIKGYVEETIQEMNKTLARAKMKKEDIDRVILVGGATNIPLVRRSVAQAVKEPYLAENVMEMVSRGAAYVAAQYMAIHDEGDEWVKEVVDIRSQEELSNRLKELYPYRLGIATAGEVPTKEAHLFPKTLGENGKHSLVEGIFSEIVEMGIQIPLSRKRGGFTTLVDNQPEVQIEIYRYSEERGKGPESSNASGMEFLGDFFLRGIPPVPAGKPRITVGMNIDNDGILKVWARDDKSGGKGELQVERALDRVRKSVE